MTALVSDPAAVVAARRVVRSWLAARGLSVLRSRIELVVSELVTNAVVHGRGLVRLTLIRRRDRVRVEVEDDGGGQPTLRVRSPAADSAALDGWGLRLVDQLTDAWGAVVTAGCTRVWCEHHVPSLAPPGRRGTPGDS